MDTLQNHGSYLLSKDYDANNLRPKGTSITSEDFKEEGDSDLENRVIDYWLGKDIYPDLELSYDEVIALQEQRYRRMAKFLRQGGKR